MKMRMNHVALTVSDRQKSAEFYADNFGLNQRIHDDEHLLILSDATGNLLALSEGDVPEALPRTNHFGFQVDTIEEVHEMREKAKAKGIVEAEWQDKNPTRLQLLDPDGYRVEIYAFDW